MRRARDWPTWLILIALGLPFGSFGVLQALLVPVLPLVEADLDTDAAGVTWTLTSWLVTAAVAMPLAGRVGDLVAKRRMLLISLAAIAIGSIVAALAPNLAVLIVARVIQGLGAPLIPLSFSLVRDVLPPERVVGGIGIVSAINALGNGVGTAFAGPLALAFGWRGLFVVPLVGVLLGGLLVVAVIPPSITSGSGRVNVAAAALLATGLVALLVPISMSAQWGWGSPTVIVCLVAATVLLGGWIAVELNSAEPLVDLRMLRLPVVWNAQVAALLIGCVMFGVWAFFTRFLQEPSSTGYGLGLTITESSLVLLPMLVCMAGAGFLVGPLERVLSSRAQVVLGAGLLGLSTIAIALVHSQPAQLAVEAAVFGTGLGLSFAATTALVVQGAPLDKTGVAAGMNSNLRIVGSAVGTAVTTAIVTGSVPPGERAGAPTESAYVAAFLVLGTAGLLAAAVAGAARGRGSASSATRIVEAPLAPSDDGGSRR